MTTASITAHGFTGFLGKGLSLRELQCVLGIAAGRTSKELALSLGVSPRTVKGAIERAMHKLNAYRRPALVAEA
uniref:response regulator transcription factor n=1 Tax=Pseudomonas aeruginosa TaxID=287 RepID=UPI003F51FC96